MKNASVQHKFACKGVIIDPEAGSVTGHSETIRLGPVNMRVFLILLENAGKVVSRTEIFEAVWENQIVSDDVLTRCISDLRKQVGGLFENEKVIETLPKRGYRWTLLVSPFESETENSSSKSQLGFREADKKEDGEITANKPDSSFSVSLTSSKLVFFSILGLLILSTSTLWIVDAVIATGFKKVALLPIETNEQNGRFADEIEQLLARELLNNKELRILAKSAVKNRPTNHFSYFTREFGTDWIIEGSLTEQQSGLRLTLNLVDARSATVSYSQTKLFTRSSLNFTDFCLEFSKKLTSHSE